MSHPLQPRPGPVQSFPLFEIEKKKKNVYLVEDIYMYVGPEVHGGLQFTNF